MILFREKWILIFLGLYFATTLTFADDDYNYEESGDGSGSGEYFIFLVFLRTSLLNVTTHIFPQFFFRLIKKKKPPAFPFFTFSPLCLKES